MKLKNKLLAVCATAMAFTMGCSAFAGCKGKENHKHTVNSWTPMAGNEATCSEGGKEHGKCAECGEPVTRDVAADPSNLALHDYGDWQITPPTQTEKGEAVKTCSRGCEENHEYKVTLPALSEGNEYNTSVLSEATVSTPGSTKYTLSTEVGDVSFTVSTTKQISTLEEAVQAGVAGAGNVRSLTGRVLDSMLYTDYATSVTKLNEYDGEALTFDDVVEAEVEKEPEGSDEGGEEDPEEAERRKRSMIRLVGCYFGDDYVHVIDKINDRDDWYSYNGKEYEGEKQVLGIRTSHRSAEGAVVTEALPNASEDNMKGFDTSLILTMGQDKDRDRYYGAEDLLAGLYREYCSQNTISIEHSLPSGDNKYYSFKYECVSDLFYNEISVKFTLAINDKGERIVDFIRVDNIAYDKDENGFAASDVPHYGAYLKYNQTFKTEADEVPENVYDYRLSYFTDFKVYYGGVEVNDIRAIDINANREIKLDVKDIVPQTADLNFDLPQLYVRVNGRDVRLTEEYNSYKVMGYYETEGKKLAIGCRASGELTLVIKTNYCEKVLKFNVIAQAPTSATSLRVMYYEYGEEEGIPSYEWVAKTQGNKISGVYVGMPLAFKLGIDQTLPEASYVDLSFSAQILKTGTNTEETQGYTLADIDADTPEGEIYGGQTVVFTATAAGVYDIRLRAGRDSSKYRTVTIEVAEAPQISSYFENGTVYETDIEYFEEASVTVTVNNNGNLYEGELVIEIEKNGGKDTVVKTYSIDEATGNITTAHKSGPTNVQKGFDTYAFTLELNEAYRLVLVHPNGFSETRPETDGSGNTQMVTVALYESKILKVKA